MSGSNTAETLWRNIISILCASPQDVQTVLQNGSAGIWIHAKSDNGVIVIDRAKNNTPSSELNSPRYINKNEFIMLYPLYFKWRKGSISREQAKGGSMSSSYIFALINKFLDDSTST